MSFLTPFGPLTFFIHDMIVRMSDAQSILQRTTVPMAISESLDGDIVGTFTASIHLPLTGFLAGCTLGASGKRLLKWSTIIAEGQNEEPSGLSIISRISPVVVSVDVRAEYISPYRHTIELVRSIEVIGLSIKREIH